MRNRHVLAMSICVASLISAASGCAPDVVGGNRPVDDDCSFGCEIEQEDPATGQQQAAATATASTGQGGGGTGGQGGAGGAGGAPGQGGAGGTGGSGGAGGA